MASMRPLRPAVDVRDLRTVVNAYDPRTATTPAPRVMSTHRASYHGGCFARLYGTHEVAGQRYYDRPYSQVKHNVSCIVCGKPLPK